MEPNVSGLRYKDSALEQVLKAWNNLSDDLVQRNSAGPENKGSGSACGGAISDCGSQSASYRNPLPGSLMNAGSMSKRARQGSTAPTSKPAGNPGNPSKRHRERLNAELDTLAALLPFNQTVINKLDKLSILRLAVSFLQVKTHFGMCIQKQAWALCFPCQFHGYDDSTLDSAIYAALGGFIIIVTTNGEIFYASSNIEKFLGFHQSDILHQPVYDMIHSEDRAEMRQILSLSVAQTDYSTYGQKQFVSRFRCLLDNTCGFLRLEIVGYMAYLHGLPNYYVTGPDPCISSVALVALCTPLVPALTNAMDGSPPILFKSKHGLDMRINSADSRFKDLLGLTPDADLPIPFYGFVHVDDLSFLAQTHNEVIKNGAAGLLVYRVYPRHSQTFIWLQTSARLFYKNGKPESISCAHRVLTEAEGFGLVSKRSSLASSLCFEDSLNPAKFPLAQSLFAASVCPSQQKLRVKRYKTAIAMKPTDPGASTSLPPPPLVNYAGRPAPNSIGYPEQTAWAQYGDASTSYSTHEYAYLPVEPAKDAKTADYAKWTHAQVQAQTAHAAHDKNQWANKQLPGPSSYSKSIAEATNALLCSWS